MRESILALYALGFSTRQIGSLLGVSKTHSARIVKSVPTLSRNYVQAAILRIPTRSIHKRVCRKRARAIWSREVGQIPRGYHIHHKDGDCTNNDLSNLECLSREEHWKRHNGNVNWPKRARRRNEDSSMWQQDMDGQEEN